MGLTAALTQKPGSLKLSEIFIEAFLNEAFCAPNEAIAAAALVGEISVGSFSSSYHLHEVQAEVERHEVSNFLSNYLSTVSFLLLDNGFDTTVVFNAVAGSIIPVQVNPDAFFGGEAMFKTRFEDKNLNTRLLVNNPLLLMLVVLRLNMEKILLTMNSVGAYRDSLKAQATDNTSPS